MNICIIGTGVSGLMAACEISNLDFVKKITIIGSSKIPSIKVGESTTRPFYFFIEKNFNIAEFVRSTDAAVKYGVYYKNWGKRDFIHFFGSKKSYLRNNHSAKTYGKLLANKDPKIHLHDLIGNKTWNFIKKNEVSLDWEEHNYSWHFDAGKFKIFLKNHLIKNKKISIIDDTIVDCKFFCDESISYIVGKNNKKYTADYFVNCSGDNKLNTQIFKDEYDSLSEYLLTNKALVCPLKYTNKREQFHPYTISKTMKNGWRWITPTQSRIGTGYVFSDNHISVDEAVNEFIEDIGDKKIEPFLVDFSPKHNKNPFKFNICSIGMSSGFLEPLDAPGLAFTNGGILKIIDILRTINKVKHENEYIKRKECLDVCKKHNISHNISVQWWCSFILHQYKTSLRNDTPFWVDHKNIECDFYQRIINSLENIPMHLLEKHEYEMFFRTTAGKDIPWKTNTKEKPFIVEELDTETIHHLEYIQSFYE